MPVPHPTINDEFSFLLASDTFAHGRVANPPHPMWVHFENLHVLQQPTFASMYPPAQGVFLAIGQRITGHPFAGVCFVVAIFCAATCWMLQGWTSPSLALLGGLLAIIHFGMALWPRVHVPPSGRSLTARKWFSNWLATAPSMVQWPELWTRGAISLASTWPPHSNSSTARTPT